MAVDKPKRPTPWTIKELLNVTVDYLTEKQIESPRLTAEILLAFQLDSNRVSLYLNLDQPLTETEVSGYRDLIRRRVRHEPLQYITGKQEFWSLDFSVDSRVLIPRPETELLVEQTLYRLKHHPFSDNHPIKIADLGTGSGILAVTLAKEIPTAQVWAVDISSHALALARKNAQAHGVLERIQFLEGDLFGPLAEQRIAFDYIVSNPPYVGTEEFGSLDPEVRDFEPRSALDGGPGGMDYLEAIIQQAPAFMNSGAWLMLEMSPPQTEKAVELIDKMKIFNEATRIKDYSNQYRVVCSQKKIF